MTTAILYGILSGSAILIGSALGLYLKPSNKLIAICMAFGAGVLFSALSIDLMNDAFDQSQDPIHIAAGFLCGALVFVLGDYLISLKGGSSRRHTNSIIRQKQQEHQDGDSGAAIFLGTLLDGIPESLVLGATISAGGNLGLVFVIALFLSNIPEGMSGSIGMKISGMSNKNIWWLWIGTFIITIVAVVIGYLFLGNGSLGFKVSSMAFASGAMLAMLFTTMVPEAFKFGGRFVALVCVLGFLTAFLLSKLS